ncbi:hypothetical protein BB559_002780 [Furculomyces boomerangus]|uniref:Chitin-binding type-4 domain-containing protein n=2 Tax=Harpellales TaxID=61421 RepID=A0A2T9YSG5_9FUNG|nr:hypothetical protein BB559_005362 [Furculomyces boomerangus]PVU95300.1 hypothetical protein BB559_002780 [Furculomyces boomerangus]PVZ98583.1 hypothetical protein BB558_005410 [Smittium angustum]
MIFHPKTILALSAFSSLCAGHGMLSYPPPRGNKEWFGTCAAGAGCKGPCDSPKSESQAQSPYFKQTNFQRGQNVTVKWNRLNHPGGFVRLAIVPFEDSDSWDDFNNNVIKYTCYETNCGPDDPNDNTFGDLAGPGNAGCSTTMTIPENLPDGLFTIQWIWYGGGIYYGEVDTSFGEYYGCSDVNIKGGPTSKSRQQPQFVGGDIAYPNENVCRYWGSNRVGDCNFGNRYPNPIPNDLLSESLEPCNRGPPQKGIPAE